MSSCSIKFSPSFDLPTEYRWDMLLNTYWFYVNVPFVTTAALFLENKLLIHGWIYFKFFSGINSGNLLKEVAVWSLQCLPVNCWFCCPDHLPSCVRNFLQLSRLPTFRFAWNNAHWYTFFGIYTDVGAFEKGFLLLDALAMVLNTSMIVLFDFSVYVHGIVFQISFYHVCGTGLLSLLKRTLLPSHPLPGWREYWIFFGTTLDRMLDLTA